MKTLQRIIVALTFIYVGCSGCAYLSARNGGDSKLNNISNSEKNKGDRPPILSPAGSADGARHPAQPGELSANAAGGLAPGTGPARDRETGQK